MCLDSMHLGAHPITLTLPLTLPLTLTLTRPMTPLFTWVRELISLMCV
jgi:hypothetical protein